MGHPIHVIGERPRDGYFYVCNDLIRVGARVLGSDGLAVMLYLLSHAGGDGKPFETSPARISAEFGWSRNRERALRALTSAEKDGRLVVRRYLRDGGEVEKRRAYVVAAGGRRFADCELTEYGRPIELPSKMHGRSAS
ncbi:hypothetical protein [Mycobacteroides abscessus]|uniref:hypothetical protein n=1 Tax=Mycobacteroides abscessus TaxID=36809 RepID=UPI0018777795|nr:hypothetical protein [Mycobacteroides abscessus]